MKKLCKNPSVQEGAVILLLGGGLLAYSLDAYNQSFIKDWAQSPSLFPMAVSLMLALLGAILLVSGVRQSAPAQAKKKGRTRPVLGILALCALYTLALETVVMPYMGVTIGSLTFVLSTFEIATALFLLAMMLYLGVKNKVVLAAVPVGTSVFLSVMFRTFLHVMLP